MAEIVLFHHLCGLTEGVRALAAAIAGDEHTVHTPDFFGGRTFDTLEEASAFADASDPSVLRARVDEFAATVPQATVFAGISWGVMHAQRLAQTRPGARAALLLEACVPITGEWAFGPWPDGVAVQIHGKDNDPFFAHEGDLDAARELVATVGTGAELFTYPGEQHLFVDSSRDSYDAEATASVVERARQLMASLDA